MNEVKLPSGETISIRPRAEVLPHRKEIASQYEMRLKEVLKDPELKIASPGKLLPPGPPSTSSNGYRNTKSNHKMTSNEWCNSTDPRVVFIPKICKRISSISSERLSSDNDAVSPLYHSPRDLEDSDGYLKCIPNKAESPGNRNSDGKNNRGSNLNSNYENYISASPTKSAYLSASPTKSPDVRKEQKSINDSPDLRLYTGNSANSAIKAIALHYMLRDQNNERTRITRALFILVPFLLSCIHWFRKRAQFLACVLIQSTIRGYFIRRDIFHLVHFLRFRKTLRKLACLFLRNWARNYADQVHCKRMSKVNPRVRRTSMMPPMSLPVIDENSSLTATNIDISRHPSPRIPSSPRSPSPR
jgi:hypothetical protein